MKPSVARNSSRPCIVISFSTLEGGRAAVQKDCGDHRRRPSALPGIGRGSDCEGQVDQAESGSNNRRIRATFKGPTALRYSERRPISLCEDGRRTNPAGQCLAGPTRLPGDGAFASAPVSRTSVLESHPGSTNSKQALKRL